MKARKKKPQILDDLQGQIERLTYTKDESSCTLAELMVYGCVAGLLRYGNVWEWTSADLLLEVHGTKDWPMQILSVDIKPH